MTKHLPALLLLLASTLYGAEEPKLSPLPIPVSNNAVVVTQAGKESRIFSFMGMSSKKTWDAVTNRAFAMDLPTGKWTEVRPVPGVVGRLAASAASLRNQIVVMGGYAIDGQGGDFTLPDVNIYYPDENRWYRAEDIPTPVDDAVVGVYRDRFVYLVSGWSKTEPTAKVQVYDTEKNKWMTATPIPGRPVFGHAGTLVGDTIVYVDGAYKNPAGENPKYVASSDCWMGKIAKNDITKIEWTKLPNHPGTARYRIAAGASPKDSKIYYSGGTDNPYNFNGVGYDGQPSEPSPVTFALNLKTAKWETIDDNTPDPVMDIHNLVVTHRGLIIVGGMAKGQTVTPKVSVIKPSPRK